MSDWVQKDEAVGNHIASSSAVAPANHHQKFMALPLPSSTQNVWSSPFVGLGETATGYGARDVLRHKMAMLEAFVANHIDPALWGQLLNNDLAGETLRIVVAAVSYFPGRDMVLRPNIYSETPHRVELWIQGKDDIGAELELLDKFDNEWLVEQSEAQR